MLCLMVISRPVNIIVSHAFQEIYVLKLGQVELSTTGRFGLYFCFSIYFFMVENFKLGQ